MYEQDPGSKTMDDKRSRHDKTGLAHPVKIIQNFAHWKKLQN